MFRTLLTRSILDLKDHPKFINKLVRSYNIRSSTYIEKIGKHLTADDDDQLIILNLPKETDYNLAKYLIDNNQKNLLLLLDKPLNDKQLKDDKHLKVIENVDLLRSKTFPKIKDKESEITIDKESEINMDKESEITIYSTIADQIKKREWTDKPAAKLFMIVPNGQKKILRSFIGQIKTFSNLFKNGRIELYLLVTDVEYNKIKSTSTSNIFFTYTYQFLYDYKLLDQLKWSDLNFKISSKSFNLKKPCYFVRLTPKKSLDTDYTKDYVSYFINFLGKMTMSRNTLMIGFFEALFPGIGIRLIDEGYSIFTKFDDLKLSDYQKIYDLLMKEESSAFQDTLQSF